MTPPSLLPSSRPPSHSFSPDRSIGIFQCFPSARLFPRHVHVPDRRAGEQHHRHLLAHRVPGALSVLRGLARDLGGRGLGRRGVRRSRWVPGGLGRERARSDDAGHVVMGPTFLSDESLRTPQIFRFSAIFFHILPSAHSLHHIHATKLHRGRRGYPQTGLQVPTTSPGPFLPAWSQRNPRLRSSFCGRCALPREE